MQTEGVRWMHTKKLIFVGFACFFAVALTGCEKEPPSPDGLYLGDSGSAYRSIQLVAPNKAIWMDENEKLVYGTYTVVGSSVTVTGAGGDRVMKIDDKGCLDGGGVGRYCR